MVRVTAPVMSRAAADLEVAAVEAVGDAPVAVVERRPGAMVLRTTRTGYTRLLADPNLPVVERVDGPPDPTPDEPVAVTRWTIELSLPAARSAGGVAVEQAGPLVVSARLRARRADGSDVIRDGTLGPDTLQVEALDGAGRVVARTVAADPRLVRHEPVDGAGRFTGKREFLRAQATLDVRLPTDPRIASLRIAEPDASGAPRVVARLAVR